MLDIAKIQTRRYLVPQQFTVFSTQRKKCSPTKQALILKSETSQRNDMEFENKTATRKSACKYPSIDYSLNFAINDKKLQFLMEQPNEEQSLFPEITGQKANNPPISNPFPHVLLSRDESIDKKVILGTKYFEIKFKQVPERQQVKKKDVHHVDEHMNNIDLRIKRINVIPAPRRNMIRILDYAKISSKNVNRKLSTSILYNKVDSRQEQPKSSQSNSFQVKSQDSLLRANKALRQDNTQKVNTALRNNEKKKAMKNATMMEPKVVKRYSQSPNTSLFTIKENVGSKKKVKLNKTFSNNAESAATINKKPKFKQKRPKKEEIRKEEAAPILERLKQRSKPVFLTDDNYMFVITFGNNSHLVRRCIERRTDWKEVPESCSIFHFKWQPFSKGIYFDQISISQKQMINHFEHHHEITTKDLLFRNLLLHLDHSKKNVFNYVPVTFLLDMDSEDFFTDLERFIYCYNTIKNTNSLKAINQKLAGFPVLKDKKALTQHKYKLLDSHFAGGNIWILKPTGFNRGRGVSVFDSIERLKKLLKYYSEGVLEAIDLEPVNESGVQNFGCEVVKSSISNINNLPSIIKSRAFVIQKYIERPLLFNERKFDIRVWALVTHEMKLYFFKEGYIRTSCEKYTINNNTIDKKGIHLTNNAIQKYFDGYGAFEDGNQISFSQFQVLQHSNNRNT